MNKTNIDWTDYTWNPETGCLGPKGRAAQDAYGTPSTARCSYCYANKLAHGRLRVAYYTNPNVAPGCHALDPFSPRFWPERMAEPAALRKPSKIFVCSMGDLFGRGVPDIWTEQVLAEIRLNPQHTFQLLTKCPGQLPRWSPFPDNAWVGVTATDNAMFETATAWLKGVKAKVKYISVEPFINRIEPWYIRYIDWLILGGLSSHSTYAPYVPDVEDLLDAADILHIPVFIKKNLDWPVERQEWPRGVGA